MGLLGGWGLAWHLFQFSPRAGAALPACPVDLIKFMDYLYKERCCLGMMITCCYDAFFLLLRTDYTSVRVSHAELILDWLFCVEPGLEIYRPGRCIDAPAIVVGWLHMC